MASTTRSRLSALAVAVAIHEVAMLFFFAPGTLSADLVIRPSGEHGVRVTLGIASCGARRIGWSAARSGTAPGLHSLGGEDPRTGDARAPEILGRLGKTPE